jgi:hypothetical protein
MRKLDTLYNPVQHQTMNEEATTFCDENGVKQERMESNKNIPSISAHNAVWHGST